MEGMSVIFVTTICLPIKCVTSFMNDPQSCLEIQTGELCHYFSKRLISYKMCDVIYDWPTELLINSVKRGIHYCSNQLPYYELLDVICERPNGYASSHKYCHLLTSRCNFEKLCLHRESVSKLHFVNEEDELFRNHQFCIKN